MALERPHQNSVQATASNTRILWLILELCSQSNRVHLSIGMFAWLLR